MRLVTIANNDVYQNDVPNLIVTFEYTLDDNGACDSTNIKGIRYFVPAINDWITSTGFHKDLHLTADELVEKWLDQNHYNETAEFRRDLNRENNCKE